MILLYELPKNEKGQLVLDFFARVKVEHKQIDKNQAGASFASLFAESCEDVPVQDAITDTSIFFSDDFTEDKARHLLELLAQVGIQFRYFALLTKEMLAKTPHEVLSEQAAHIKFIKEISFLQKLIDGCGKLKQGDYDPDRWSELKFAIADANDLLDATFGESEGQMLTADEVEKVSQALKKKLDYMLTYKPQH